MAEKDILIVEDNIEISGMLSEFLRQNDFVPTAVFNGLDGLRLASSGEFALVLLDIMLPFKNGDEVLRELRLASDVPVIILSAKGLTFDKIELLNLGADDYMTKPFDLNELAARIGANIRRKTPAVPGINRLTYKNFGLVLDSEKFAAEVDGKPLNLTAKEYEILALMLANPDKVFSKQNLYESVWGETYAYDNDTINTHISNLRKKLESAGINDMIETVWGIGYKLK
ncbi:DNA-binding response regulator [Clostridia bacterium]|nr:DNA-binding response regulator [Clostridia bacterium]